MLVRRAIGWASWGPVCWSSRGVCWRGGGVRRSGGGVCWSGGGVRWSSWGICRSIVRSGCSVASSASAQVGMIDIFNRSWQMVSYWVESEFISSPCQRDGDPFRTGVRERAAFDKTGSTNFHSLLVTVPIVHIFNSWGSWHYSSAFRLVDPISRCESVINQVNH